MILIGLLHKSRKAKEKEREKEESEGWVKFVPSCRLMWQACRVVSVCLGDKQRVCSAVLSWDCEENFIIL